jgi:prophage maintenance system killer protein
MDVDPAEEVAREAEQEERAAAAANTEFLKRNDAYELDADADAAAAEADPAMTELTPVVGWCRLTL